LTDATLFFRFSLFFVAELSFVCHSSLSGAVLSQHDLPVQHIIEKAARQIEEWVRIPEATSEQFYVLRYELGQQYEPHTDFYKGMCASRWNIFLFSSSDYLVFFFFCFSVLFLCLTTRACCWRCCVHGACR
jgi:hypothetical protein